MTLLSWVGCMGRSFYQKTTFFILFAIYGADLALALPNDDLVTVLDGKQYSVSYYKSSIKALPPDWKKVWVIINRRQDESSS